MNCFGDDTSQKSAKPYGGFARLLGPIGLLSRLAALLVLLIYLPALAAVALLVLLTSVGPAVVKKAYRRGDGSEQVVYLYEFRTECWRTWERTTVGSLLHLLDFHRMPRLMNVLQGQVRAGERVQPLRT